MVIVEDCEGLVDEVSTEFDDELVELDWLLELVEDSLEVDEGLVVFFSRFFCNRTRICRRRQRSRRIRFVILAYSN